MGEGVVQDSAEALKWIEKAADQGLFKAQLSMGMAYMRGEDVPQSNVSAHMWFNLAAWTGDMQAEVALNELAQSMTPEQIAEAEKLAREWKAAHGKM